MKVLFITGILLVSVIIIYGETRGQDNGRREMTTAIAITALTAALAILLVFFPDMPGPTELIAFLFSSMGMK
ncbi:hypothetical protein ABEW34_31015 [Paenibacillus algorifonticola]|uniref:hypothetical protein n=1 Tax=Paenibacillus algorifonticola TaxID=684063 RepID=UPI003D2D22E0